MSQVPQIHALTSIRGIAAWWVVFYHFRELFPGGTPDFFFIVAESGYLAVDLFFILSGFVIMLNYQNKIDALNWSQIVSFYSGRIARIYPLHFFMLTIFLVNPLAIHFFSSQSTIDSRYDASYFVLSLFLVQNWGLSTDLAWNIPAWSISTEWFAYLLFPLSCFYFNRIQKNAPLILAHIGLLLFILAWSASHFGGLGAQIEKFGLWRCVLEFQIGVALCLLRKVCWNNKYRLTILSFCSFSALIFLYTNTAASDYMVMPLALSFFVFYLTGTDGFIAKILHMRGLLWLGEISYSTYLVHFFVKDWVKFLLVEPGDPGLVPIAIYVSAVLISSALLYRWVEKPGQRWTNAWLKRLP